MNFSWEFVKDTIQYVAAAIPMTMLLTFFPVIVGLVLGFFLAIAKIKRIPVLSQVINVYNSFFRSVPLVVLLFLVYYGLPKLINYLLYDGIRTVSIKNINNNLVAIITLTLYASAFLCEIVRGALSSVDMKQREAATALGMTTVQTYLRIIIPQAIKNILPALGNEMITLLKDTSLVSVIALRDVTKQTQNIVNKTYQAFVPYISLAIIYLVIVIVLTKILGVFERRLRKSDH